MALSTFYYKYHNRSTVIKKLNHQPTFLRTQFTENEEGTILSLCIQQSDRGHPLSISDIKYAADILISTMPHERRTSLRFINGRPGEKWVKGFRKRHMNKFFIGGRSPQEAERWASKNSTTLTTHITSLEHIIKTNNIPPSHIANLDETGVTPNCDTKGKMTGKVAMRRSMRAMGGNNQMRSAHFRNVGLVTMMPVVYADGGCGRPLFVVQGRTLPCRIVEVNGVGAI